MFEVPRTAGGHPRLVLGVLGALILGAAVWAGVATTVAPKSDAALIAERADAPPRPPVVVVQDLPQLAARLARAMDHWRRLAEPYRTAAREALSRVAARTELSDDVREIVTRALQD